jgi:RNA recognition motif-containing protein
MGSTMNIFVGNLPLELTEDEIRTEFLVFGQVKSVNIMNDKDIGSGQQCGYGFVEMTLESEGTTAVASLKGKKIGGRVIEVIQALCFSGDADRKSIDSRRGNRFNRIKQRANRNKLHHYLP